MKTAIAIKCPRCGADLDAESDREMLFCQYCGAKIILSDENTYTINKNITINQTIHHVDDAKITRAETERMVQMHQIEKDRNESNSKVNVLILKIVFSVILAIVGFFLATTENDFFFGDMFCFLAIIKKCTIGVVGNRICTGVCYTEDSREECGDKKPSNSNRKTPTFLHN